MIGTHYRDDFNCAHFVAKWYAEKLDIEIPIVDEFEISFVRWMRKHFVKINRPEENCLVTMNQNKTSHIGVYSDWGVYHNYKAGKALGSVVHWNLGVVKRNYQKVSYWKWLQ